VGRHLPLSLLPHLASPWPGGRRGPGGQPEPPVPLPARGGAPGRGLMASWGLLEMGRCGNLQRITRAPHGAHVVWPDLDEALGYREHSVILTSHRYPLYFKEIGKRPSEKARCGCRALRCATIEMVEDSPYLGAYSPAAYMTDTQLSRLKRIPSGRTSINGTWLLNLCL
jgi:hypothetical protein